MGTLKGLSMEEFKAGLEKLNSEGLKFDVKSKGGGNIFLSLPGCNISVCREYEDICGEIVITKPEVDVKISIDFDAVDDVLKEDDMKYCIQMDESMCMSDIEISTAE